MFGHTTLFNHNKTMYAWSRHISTLPTRWMFGCYDQALTSTRYPTWPELFFATRTRPELFFKISEFMVFPSRQFPSSSLQTFYNHPQIMLFSSHPDTKSSVPKLKCLRYKRWIQGKSGKFDNWFIMHFDLFQSRQSNTRFIHVEAIKSINQDGDKLLSNEAHARRPKRPAQI